MGPRKADEPITRISVFLAEGQLRALRAINQETGIPVSVLIRKGVDCHSCPLPRQVALAVCTDRPRLFEKLWAIPGVKRHQTGDTELRAVFPPEALEQVARVIWARRHRELTPKTARELGAKTAYRTTYRP